MRCRHFIKWRLPLRNVTRAFHYYRYCCCSYVPQCHDRGNSVGTRPVGLVDCHIIVALTIAKYNYSFSVGTYVPTTSEAGIYCYSHWGTTSSWGQASISSPSVFQGVCFCCRTQRVLLPRTSLLLQRARSRACQQESRLVRWTQHLQRILHGPCLNGDPGRKQSNLQADSTEWVTVIHIIAVKTRKHEFLDNIRSCIHS